MFLRFSKNPTLYIQQFCHKTPASRATDTYDNSNCNVRLKFHTAENVNVEHNFIERHLDGAVIASLAYEDGAWSEATS